MFYMKVCVDYEQLKELFWKKNEILAPGKPAC